MVKKKGFTLLEVIISLGLFCVIMVGVTAMVFTAQENRRRSEVIFGLDNYGKLIEEKTRVWQIDTEGKYYIYFNSADKVNVDGLEYILDNFLTEKVDTVNQYVVAVPAGKGSVIDDCKSLNTFGRKYGAYFEINRDTSIRMDTVEFKVWDINNSFNKLMEISKKFYASR